MRLRADFNGLFRADGGFILCLSHREMCHDEDGNEVPVHAGMVVTAFDEDLDDEGNRDDLLASGTVEQAPDWLANHGSRWVLRVDERGVWHESDKRPESAGGESGW